MLKVNLRQSPAQNSTSDAFGILEKYRSRVLFRQLSKAKGSHEEISRLSQYDIQEMLKKESAGALMFFFGEQSIFCLEMNGNDMNLRTLNDPDGLRNLVYKIIRESNDPGSAPDRFNLTEAASWLLSESFQKDITGFRKLYILPDDCLFMFPFDLIITERDQERSTYMGSCKEMVLVPSWRALMHNSQKSSGADHSSFLGLYGVYQDERTQNALGWCKQEVERAAEKLNWKKSAVYSGPEFFEKPEQETEIDYIWDVIHIAGHIRNDPLNPWNSRIILSQSRNTRGLLREIPIDIGRWNPRARLVILSGCSSMVGKTYSGEGIVNMARLFMANGSGGIIATLWPVSDQASYRFMKLFYDSLSENQGEVLAALQYAKSQMRMTPEYNHPAYWAGYVFYGNPVCLRVSGERFKGICILTFLLVGLVSGFLLHRKRRKGKTNS